MAARTESRRWRNCARQRRRPPRRRAESGIECSDGRGPKVGERPHADVDAGAGAIEVRRQGRGRIRSRESRQRRERLICRRECGQRLARLAGLLHCHARVRVRRLQHRAGDRWLGRRQRRRTCGARRLVAPCRTWPRGRHRRQRSRSRGCVRSRDGVRVRIGARRRRQDVLRRRRQEVR